MRRRRRYRSRSKTQKAPTFSRKSMRKSAPAADVVSKTIRLRDKEHCKFVSRQPCVVCGRTPSDPHHLRYAKARALGRKVSDEYTVPVCRTHHRELRSYGDEASWWGVNARSRSDRARAVATDATRPGSALSERRHAFVIGDARSRGARRFSRSYTKVGMVGRVTNQRISSPPSSLRAPQPTNFPWSVDYRRANRRCRAHNPERAGGSRARRAGTTAGAVTATVSAEGPSVARTPTRPTSGRQPM